MKNYQTAACLVNLLMSLMLAGTAESLHLQAAKALSGEVGDQSKSVLSATDHLNTKLPGQSDSKSSSYYLQVKKSQEPKALGREPLESSKFMPLNPDVENSARAINDQAFVPLNRPPLQALISVQDNLSPFSMDARYFERIGLSDALKRALGENLTLENQLDELSSQRYAYLSALSKFLPDLSSGFNLVALKGNIPGSIIGFGTNTAASGGSSNTINLPSHLEILQAGFTYHVYQGGSVLFSALQEKHRLKASRASLRGSVNDVLLETADRYYTLVLNEALLDIRRRAVDISKEQVRLNVAQEKAGTATGLDVLQSQAQLASDEQNLVDQQNARRQAAIQLTTSLNASFAQDLGSDEGSCHKRRVVPRLAPVETLLKFAIDNRPELKQYEELRLAAKRAIVVAAAPLQPKVNLGGSVYGVGAAGASTTSIFLLDFSINWSLGGLGTTDLANIQRARWQARQATVQAKQSFQDVFREVHSSYDQSLAADNKIEHASAQIEASEEELRIAKKRAENGIGLNLDVLNAQRDLTQASINKAQAIVEFNRAQAQLLHDIGLISTNTLVNGASI